MQPCNLLTSNATLQLHGQKLTLITLLIGTQCCCGGGCCGWNGEATNKVLNPRIINIYQASVLLIFLRAGKDRTPFGDCNLRSTHCGQNSGSWKLPSSSLHWITTLGWRRQSCLKYCPSSQEKVSFSPAGIKELTPTTEIDCQQPMPIPKYTFS